MDNDERKDCPIRCGNGNCLCIGGFCTAVNDEICKGLRNAYKTGVEDGRIKVYEKKLQEMLMEGR